MKQFARKRKRSSMERCGTRPRLHCGNLTKGVGRGGRVPRVQELASLVDPTSPTFLPARHPFANVGSVIYWSGTSDSRTLPRRGLCASAAALPAAVSSNPT